jgi:hypothetical protein
VLNSWPVGEAAATAVLVCGGVLVVVDESAEDVDAVDVLRWTGRYGRRRGSDAPIWPHLCRQGRP